MGEKLALAEKEPDGRLPPKVYSVPRRFGIGTLMGVALAFALLIATMQQLDAPPVVIVVNGTFLTLIGLLQAVMTKAPRWASTLAGALCFYGWYLWLIWDGDDHVCLFLSMLVGGAIYGYLGGTMVAGVFLVFDAIAQFIRRRSCAISDE